MAVCDYLILVVYLVCVKDLCASMSLSKGETILCINMYVGMARIFFGKGKIISMKLSI